MKCEKWTLTSDSYIHSFEEIWRELLISSQNKGDGAESATPHLRIPGIEFISVTSVAM